MLFLRLAYNFSSEGGRNVSETSIVMQMDISQLLVLIMIALQTHSQCKSLHIVKKASFVMSITQQIKAAMPHSGQV